MRKPINYCDLPVMPNIDFNQFSAMPLKELTFADAAGLAAHDNSAELFNDYLKRADLVSQSAVAAAPSPASRAEDRSPPRKTETPSHPADRTDGPPKSPSADTHDSDDPLPSANETGHSAGEDAAPTEDRLHEAQDGASKTPLKDASESESQISASEKDSVKDKKEAKGEKKDAESADPAVAGLRKDATGLPTAQEANAQTNDCPKETNAEQLPETAMARAIAGSSDANSALTGDGSDESRTGVAASTEKSQQNLDATATNEHLAVGGTSQPADDAADSKTKTKKSRTAADVKNGPRQQKTAARSVDASATQDANSAPAAAAKDATDAQPANSAVLPSASVLPTITDALKHAEKPALNQDSVSPIADVRAGAQSASPKTTDARGSGSAMTTNGSDASAQVARAQFVQRVERAFAAMGNREGSVRLKLSPPELGILKLEIGIHRGVMKARVEAETPDAQSLLLENLPALRERLAQQNIHVQQFDVDLMDRQPGGTPQQAFDQSGSGGQHGSHHAPRGNIAESAATAPISPTVTQRAGMGGGLNVIV
jgi:flagellar hook-length control protein FliK